MTGLNSNIYKKINERRAQRNSFPVSIQKMRMIDTASSRIVVKIDSVFHDRLNEETASASISALGVRYLPNSLHRVSDKDSTLFGAFVAKNRETMSHSDAKEMASAGTMTQVSDTVFQDSNDFIWSVVSDGDTAYLVKQQDEDIGALLNAQHARAIATASHEVSLFEDYGPGMPFVYYDTRKEEMAFAIGVTGTTAYNPDTNSIREIASDMVVGVWDGRSVNVSEVAAGGVSKEDILEYYSMLYSHNKEFLAEIKDIIYNGVNV